MKQQKRKLPYLTEDDLNSPVKSIVIAIEGSYTKRGEQRKDVYEDSYQAEVIVPEKYNMGHVKLAADRHVKNVLKGIRARTYNIDRDVEPKPADKQYKVKDFMSHQGLLDNDSLKRDYEIKQAKRRAQREAAEAGFAPPQFSDDTDYGDDGLPPLKLGPGVA